MFGKILLWIALVLLVVNLTIWALFHASGHKIPENTDSFYRSNSVILLVSVVIFWWYLRRMK